MPYNEQFYLNRVGPEVLKAYKLANRIPGDDPGYAVWPARVQADIDFPSNMDPEASLMKHLYGPGELYASLGVAIPFHPAPRTYKGNMCGVRIEGLPPVPGGAADPSLVLSWFYDRYNEQDRAKIRQIWAEKGYLDVLVSWPDSQAFGHTPEQFKGTCQELMANGFRPNVFLCAKPTSSAGIMTPQQTLENIMLVLPSLLEAGVASRICVGWELSLWLSPTDVQMLINAIVLLCVPLGVKVYVHFQEGYFAFQQPDHPTCDFWNLNVKKLAGVFHQKDLSWDIAMYQARIVDCLQRFAGQDGFVADGGFGYPFDFIALEISAATQFNGQMSEADGDTLGRVALATPGVMGPLGMVVVMGTGNGG